MTSYDICLSLSDSFHLVWPSLSLTMLLQMALFHSVLWPSNIPLYAYTTGFPGGASSKEPIRQCKRHKGHRFNPWVRRDSLNSLQYSCLENPMDRGARLAMVQGVTESQTLLKQLSTHACMHIPHVLYPFICLKKMIQMNLFTKLI